MKTQESRFQVHDELTAPERSLPVLKGALAGGGQLPNFVGVLAGSPAHDGPPRRVQKFAGTDRQVRGRLLDVLRTAHEPVDATALEPAWDDAVQRSRCLTVPNGHS